MLPACRAREEESRLGPLLVSRDFFDENIFAAQENNCRDAGGLVSRGLVPHCAPRLPRVSRRILGRVYSCADSSHPISKIASGIFFNSSGEEVFPEPTSSYKLGVPNLYDAGGAHLGARFFLLF